jgi:hypothetical protein
VNRILHKNLFMFGRRASKQHSGTGSLDGGQGRGVPMGSSGDERRPSGYDALDDEQGLEVENDDREPFLWEDGDPADRRRDPMRKPGT